MTAALQRKARGDSKLKTLSPDKQKLIIEWMQSGTRDQARRKCAGELGVETSGAALSEFYSWWHLGRQLTTAAEFANSVKEDLKGLAGLHVDEEQLGLIGQTIFEKQALEAGNFKQFYHLRVLRQKDRKLKLEFDKLKERVQGKIEAGLDALAQEIKGNAEAEGLLARILEIVKAEVKAA